MSLKQYIDQTNELCRVFNRPEYSYPPSKEEANQLMRRVESALSPENLTCDGELPRAEVQRRAQYLNTVQAELMPYL